MGSDGYQQEYHSGSAHESRDDSFIDKVLTHAESKPLKAIDLSDICVHN